MSDSRKRRLTVKGALTPPEQVQDLPLEDPFAFSLYRPQDAAGLHVYQYHHLDDLSFAREPEKVFANLKPAELKRLVDAVEQRFRTAGWEGDGKLEVLWLPPFVDVGVEDTWGTYLWHVKQENNGTSWIGSKHALGFGRIKDQNERFPYETHAQVSIVYDAGLTMVRGVEANLKRVRSRISALDRLSDPQVEEIANELRIAAQGELTSGFQTFLDDCYLELLTDILERGNRSNLHLARLKVNLDLSGVQSVDDRHLRDREREEIRKWLTLKGLVHDVWSSFTFEPFSLKMQSLFRACEYKVDEEIRREVTKHVLLRNCVQHHHRRVTADALKNAGLKNFSVLNERLKPTKLSAGATITFSLPELESLGRSLTKLAAEFDQHVGKRVRSFTWVPREQLPKHKEPNTI